MSKPKPYNGHPSWAAWNVSLWIMNDEGLYNLARECVRSMPGRSKTQAAENFCDLMRESGSIKTPDGAMWTVRNVRRAISEL